MGESKRRKQVYGSSYGQPIPLEECIVPSEVSFGYAGDNEVSNSKKDLAKMSEDFKSVLLACVLKAKSTSSRGIVYAETSLFSGKTGVEVTFRSDIETFVHSRCNVGRHKANELVAKLKEVDYETNRVIGLLGGSSKPVLTINVYTLPQLQILLKNLELYTRAS
ncbi:MAG: hypothetical protein HC815_40190 [Richelia sp. RM1_1_1]|nr:hypothetical protein [Richelia sp. RM1_1_1]